MSKRDKEKEKETKKEKNPKPKTERQSRGKNQSNLQIDPVNRSRSKSSTRRSKPSSGRPDMEWDGKKWAEKKTKEDEHSEKACKSDKSNGNFMDAKHEAELMDKLMG